MLAVFHQSFAAPFWGWACEPIKLSRRELLEFLKSATVPLLIYTISILFNQYKSKVRPPYLLPYYFLCVIFLIAGRQPL